MEIFLKQLSLWGHLGVVTQLAQIALVFIAFGTAIFAGIQLSLIRKSHNHSLEQMKAQFLFELDRRWDDEMMIVARREFSKLRDEVAVRLTDENPHLDQTTILNKYREEYSKILFEIKKKDTDKYLVYMRMCNFFETVGLMVKRGYVSLENINGLFKGPIIGVNAVFGVHIKSRQEMSGVPNGLYENVIYLCDEVEKGVN